MKIFTFTGASGETTRVKANNEYEGRDLAMFARWGEPDGKVLLKRPYEGWGLTLINTEEVPVGKPVKRAAIPRTGKRNNNTV